jgi:hypothetical protein
LPALKLPNEKSNNNYSNKGTAMTPTQNQTYPKNPQKYSIPYLALILSLPLILTTACTTTCHRRDRITLVLDQQNELLQKVRAEREAEPIAKRLKADPILQPAETHLQESIDALLHANSAIKSGL